jgi:hypothetical protein
MIRGNERLKARRGFDDEAACKLELKIIYFAPLRRRDKNM